MDLFSWMILIFNSPLILFFFLAFFIFTHIFDFLIIKTLPNIILWRSLDQLGSSIQLKIFSCSSRLVNYCDHSSISVPIFLTLKRAFKRFKNRKQYLISKEKRIVPPDLVMEIMSYMSVEDILKCKSVSKSWAEMLCTSYLVNLQKSRHKSLPVASLNYIYGCRPVPRSVQGVYNVMASCDGLSVMRRKYGYYVIENPALRKEVGLPPPPVDKWERMQLYYVPSTNQHKLVAAYANWDSMVLDLYILTIGEVNWRRLPDCWAHEYSFSMDAPHLFRSFWGSDFYNSHQYYSFDTNDRLFTLDMESEKLIEHELPKKMIQFDRQRLVGETVLEFSEGWKGFMAIIFYDKFSLKVFVLEDYKSSKWVQRDLIHNGLIDGFKEVKQIRGQYPYHVYTDDEDCLWFQHGHRKTYSCHLGTQKKKFYDFMDYGRVNFIYPFKNTMIKCKGM